MKDPIYRIAKSFRSGILGKRPSDQMCFAVCAPLQSLLATLGYESDLVEGHIKSSHYVGNHYWLKLSDGRIIDPTADQFPKPTGEPMPEVYIGEKPEWYTAFTLP